MKTPRIFLMITLRLSFFQMASIPVSWMEDRSHDLQNPISAIPEAFSPESRVSEAVAVDDDWFFVVRKNIQAEEYEVSYQDHSCLPGLKGAIQAPNRAHNLRTYFTPRGVAVILRTASRPEWVWRVNLKGSGYSGDVAPVGPPYMADRYEKFRLALSARIPFGRSRWLTVPKNGWRETDLLTAVKPKLSSNNVSVAEGDSGRCIGDQFGR